MFWISPSAEATPSLSAVPGGSISTELSVMLRTSSSGLHNSPDTPSERLPAGAGPARAQEWLQAESREPGSPASALLPVLKDSCCRPGPGAVPVGLRQALAQLQPRPEAVPELSSPAGIRCSGHTMGQSLLLDRQRSCTCARFSRAGSQQVPGSSQTNCSPDSPHPEGSCTAQSQLECGMESSGSRAESPVSAGCR